MVPRAFIVVTGCAAVAAAAIGAACSAGSGESSAFSPTIVINTATSDASDASEPTAATAATGSSAPSTIQGSPLCNASPASAVCYPDDPATAKACGTAPDGGTYDPAASYEGGVLACHIVSEGGVPATPAPTCLTAGTGPTGASCEASTDCAATEECVGPGVCRSYCCSAPCDSQSFCDIQPETQNPALVVPVCMPVQPCDLLGPTGDAGSCPSSETCTAFVTSGGAGMTTCVDVGPAREGDSCDALHCAQGLVCLGMWGEKRCYTLCRTDAGADCTPAQTCTGGLPLFPNPAVGLCEQPDPDF